MKGSSSSHDLYARLGIKKDSTLQEHPDKNPDNPKAMQTFQKAVEAYSILTDDLSREMYDFFGYESLNSCTYPFTTQTSYTTSTATSSQYYTNSSHFTQTTTFSSNTNNNNPSSNINNTNDPFFNSNNTSTTPSSTTLPKSSSSPIPSDIKNEFSNSNNSNNSNDYTNRVYSQNTNTTTPSYTQHYSFTNVSFKIPNYKPKTQIVNVNCSLNELYSGCTKQLKLISNSKKVAFIEVEVPKGSVNGTILKTPTSLKDKLDYDPNTIQFVVKELPHKIYKRVNNDLVYEVQINWIDALLGTEINIPTIDGKIINKHIECIKSSNSVMIIPKCGMIYYNSELSRFEKGNMIVKFNIVFDNLNDEMKNELMKFKI